MSTDSSMDFLEKLFPLVNRDALHEHSRWTSLVKFVTNGVERLGASSDLSHFSPFRWENLLEEVGEQWYSPVNWFESITAMPVGDVAMEAPMLEPPSTWSGSRHVGGSEPPGTRLVLEWV